MSLPSGPRLTGARVTLLDSTHLTDLKEITHDYLYEN